MPRSLRKKNNLPQRRKKIRRRKTVALANSAAVNNDIGSIIKELCEVHTSGDIQNDIIALFEDIIRYFSGREEEFSRLKDMPQKDQEEIYQEIMTIINFLRSLGQSVDKQEIITVLSKKLINRFSKSKSRDLFKEQDIISKEEQKRIKELFARITMHQMHLARNKSPSKMSGKVELLKKDYNKFFIDNLKSTESFKEKEILNKAKKEHQRHRSI